MAPKLGRYVGHNISHVRAGGIKCYFVESDNPQFRYSLEPHRYEEMAARRSLIKGHFEKEKGFALVWKPDVIVGTVRMVNGNPRGFVIKDYDFEEIPNSGMPARVELGLDVPLTEICQINAEMIGRESKFLRKSASIDEYLEKWVKQKWFRQIPIKTQKSSA